VASGSQSAASFEQLDGVIREAMERLRVPGVAVGVHHHGEFLRNPDGTIAWLRWGGRVSRKM